MYTNVTTIMGCIYIFFFFFFIFVLPKSYFWSALKKTCNKRGHLKRKSYSPTHPNQIFWILLLLLLKNGFNFNEITSKIESHLTALNWLSLTVSTWRVCTFGRLNITLEINYLHSCTGQNTIYRIYIPV